jgi:DNA mismatch repair protein MutS2
MLHTSAAILEFEPLLELIGRFVWTPLGRRELSRVKPLSDRSRMERTLEESREALEYTRLAAAPQSAGRGAAIRPKFAASDGLEPSVAKLRIEGAALEGKELAELANFLDLSGEARALILSAEERFPLLASQARRLADFRPVLRDLSGKILPDGSLADDASVALNRLRREMEKQQKQIQISLERFLRAHRDDGTLQEEFITLRNDRFVVPVVAGQRRRVEGVIHGASHSGRTMFVEPLETIDLNNELVRLRDEEEAEVRRILGELTGRLRAQAAEIRAAVDIMAALELLFAKAAFAREFDAVVPSFSPRESRRLELKDARHPLLQDVLRRQGKPIVPISLELDEASRTLLISGPNTGGKTVTMKTVGLLCLMAHAGLPVPASSAEFPVVDQVLADVGDHQSIEESLSSFSSHVVSLKGMLEVATRDSLVLLDELGRATDPEEGGALGVSLLDAFRQTGAFSLASTHLLALKVYGANTPGVVNASMGFNEETLAPTYVLRLGAPGKSAGLDIASRLGLSPALIEAARQRMSSQERDLAKFLAELHQRLENVTQLEAELRTQLDRLTARESELEREFARRRDAKLRELDEKSRELAAQFEQQAKSAIESLSEAMEQRKAAEQALRKVAKTKREFLETVTQEVAREKPAVAQERPALAEGVNVRLKGVRQPARVRKIHADGRIEVEAGLMKMQVSHDDIEEVLSNNQAQEARLPRNVSYQQGPSWTTSYSELNVIGKHADEACDEVDKFLDQAALAQVDRVRIVHGFGMGRLRKAISDLLGKNPHVARFYLASTHEGGGGATVVELKN